MIARITVMLAAVFLFTAAPSRAAESSDRHAALLERGNAALARAMAHPERESGKTFALREASAAYRTVLDDGLDGAALRLNLASIDAQLGRRGDAVLNLRAAGRLALGSGDEPARRSADAALRAIRPGAGQAWPPENMATAPRLALEAAHSAGTMTLLGVFVGCWTIGWLLVALRAAKVGPQTPLLVPTAVLLAAAMAGGVLGTAAVAESHAASFGVIVRDGVTPRAGPGESFDAVALSVSEGADVRITSRRDGWIRVRAAGGEPAWVQADAVARVITTRRR